MEFPSVICVMVTNDRPELARLAIECFRNQAYPASRRRLLIVNSGADPIMERETEEVYEPCFVGLDAVETLGEIRNQGNKFAGNYYGSAAHDIIVHWDDDDWSHPNRIAEQVDLLQSSGADCVGYNEMLFWREQGKLTHHDVEIGIHPRDLNPGEAWLYSQPNPRAALGTSLCYWREVWERNPFPALNNGEDTAWLQRVRCHSITSVETEPVGDMEGRVDPRMIARIHAGNAGNIAYRPDLMAANEKQGDVWKRVPHWDEHCRMTLEGKG